MFTGTVTLFTLDPTAKWTSPNEPGNRRPSLLGTSTSVSSVLSVGVNGFGSSRHRGYKLLSGKLLQRNEGLGADLYVRSVGLRHAGINPQRIDSGQIKQLAACGLSTGIDQRARIHIASV